MRINIENLKNALPTLKHNDIVYLSGKILTARDAAHKKICDNLDKGIRDICLDGRVIFYVGACKNGEKILSGGPTTSMRMDKYVPKLLHNGLLGMIGKGKRSGEVMQEIKKSGAVYFVAIGGAGAYYASCVKSSKLIAFPELLSEAVYEWEIENFPCVVCLE